MAAIAKTKDIYIEFDDSSGRTRIPLESLEISYGYGGLDALATGSVTGEFWSSAIMDSPFGEEENDMRYLFNVYVVDPEVDALIINDLVIAKSPESAKLKLVGEWPDKIKGDYDDYDFIVVKLGEVRPKREVQEVKVIE